MFNPCIKAGSLLMSLNAAGLLSYKHKDFNNLRWLKGSVIIPSLVKTGSRISSVSFYTPQPPHSSWDCAEVLLPSLEVDAKNKSWVWDGLRGQLKPQQALWGEREHARSRGMSRVVRISDTVKLISSTGNFGLSLDVMGVTTGFFITEE